jgi:hypothetical protein
MGLEPFFHGEADAGEADGAGVLPGVKVEVVGPKPAYTSD